MGVAFADSHTWWINDYGNETRAWEDTAAQFPETSLSSPVLGFARDGFPIFGPYDDAGNLQRSAGFGGDLDECNGKMDSNGNYGYYFSVDPPFAPVCLRGEIGTFSYSTTDITCPKEGIRNQVMLADMDTAVGKNGDVGFEKEKIPVEPEPADEMGEEAIFMFESGATTLAATFALGLMGAIVALSILSSKG